MLIDEINYDYDQLLAALERHLTALNDLPSSAHQKGDLNLMQKGATEYFYLLADWHPQAAGDVGQILETLDTKP